MKRTVYLGLALTATIYSSNLYAQSANVAPLAGQQVSYNYAGLHYVSQDLDDYNCTQDGLGIYGSMDLNSGWYAGASFLDVSGGGCGSSTIEGHGGFRTEFNAMFDMYGTVGFESISADVGDGDSGLVVAGGLRGFVKPQLEAQFELNHHTAGDGTTAISAGGSYWFQSNIAATASLAIGSDVTQFSIGAKMNF